MTIINGENMKPQSAKSKGRKFQQDIKSMMLSLAPQLEKDDIISTSMGCGGEDLQLSPAARRVYPLVIECKHQKRINWHEAYSQALEHAQKGEPIVVGRRDRESAKVLVDAEFFFSLFNQ